MKLTIEALAAYLNQLYSGKATEQSLMMKLVEEMGEVAEVLNKRAGFKASQDENLTRELGEELADVIHYTVAIAAINQIDLAQVMVRKDRIASIKYHHPINLEDFQEAFDQK